MSTRLFGAAGTIYGLLGLGPFIAAAETTDRQLGAILTLYAGLHGAVLIFVGAAILARRTAGLRSALATGATLLSLLLIGFMDALAAPVEALEPIAIHAVRPVAAIALTLASMSYIAGSNARPPSRPPLE
ncbi:MAG: hypothetical protein ACRDE6_05905 [Candidatus Limnocylindria bacterium]